MNEASYFRVLLMSISIPETSKVVKNWKKQPKSMLRDTEEW